MYPMISQTYADVQCGASDSHEIIRIRIPTPIDTDIVGGSHYCQHAISGHHEHVGPPCWGGGGGGNHALVPFPLHSSDTQPGCPTLLELGNWNVVACRRT